MVFTLQVWFTTISKYRVFIDKYILSHFFIALNFKLRKSFGDKKNSIEFKGTAVFDATGNSKFLNEVMISIRATIIVNRCPMQLRHKCGCVAFLLLFAVWIEIILNGICGNDDRCPFFNHNVNSSEFLMFTQNTINSSAENTIISASLN